MPGTSRIGSNPRLSSTSSPRLSTVTGNRRAAMRVFYFSEMAYHPAWAEGLKRGSLRVVLPNANYDPLIGHRLLNRYLDDLGADGAGDNRPRDQTFAAFVARYADRQPPRPGARRRGDGVARRIVRRP